MMLLGQERGGFRRAQSRESIGVHIEGRGRGKRGGEWKEGGVKEGTDEWKMKSVLQVKLTHARTYKTYKFVESRSACTFSLCICVCTCIKRREPQTCQECPVSSHCDR